MNPSPPIDKPPRPGPPPSKRPSKLRRTLEILAIAGFWLGFAVFAWNWVQPILQQAREGGGP